MNPEIKTVSILIAFNNYKIC